MNLNNRTLWLVSWGIALPTLVLVGLGLRAAFQGQELAELRLVDMERNQTEATSTQASEWMTRRATAVLTKVQAIAEGADEWSSAYERIESEDPLVSHVFVANLQGVLTWPTLPKRSLLQTLTTPATTALPTYLGLGAVDDAGQGGDNADTADRYRAALESFRPLLQQSDPWLRALALDLTARCYMALEQWDRALVTYQELAREHGGIVDAAGVPLKVGVEYEVAYIHSRLGQHRELAERYLTVYGDLVANRVAVGWEVRRHLCDLTREALAEALHRDELWPDLAEKYSQLRDQDLRSAEVESFLTTIWPGEALTAVQQQADREGLQWGGFGRGRDPSLLYWVAVGEVIYGFRADARVAKAELTGGRGPVKLAGQALVMAGERPVFFDDQEESTWEVPVNAMPGWRVISVSSTSSGSGAEADYVYGWLALLSALILSAGIVALIRTGRRRLQTVQLQADFVSAVSHELRTPLTSMRMFSEMLLKSLQGVDKQNLRFAQNIQRECRRLEHLVQNVLTYAQSERDELVCSLADVDIGDVVRQAVEGFEPFAVSQGASVGIVVDAGLPTVSADADRLESVVFDLLDNAVRYGPRDGRVEVTVRAQNGSVVLQVADEGPGIPLRERHRIFHSFYRGSEAQQRGKAGTGLGLALVKRITEAHGGVATVDSGADGGSVFRVALPAKRH